MEAGRVVYCFVPNNQRCSKGKLQEWTDVVSVLVELQVHVVWSVVRVSLAEREEGERCRKG